MRARVQFRLSQVYAGQGNLLQGRDARILAWRLRKLMKPQDERSPAQLVAQNFEELVVPWCRWGGLIPEKLVFSHSNAGQSGGLLGLRPLFLLFLWCPKPVMGSLSMATAKQCSVLWVWTQHFRFYDIGVELAFPELHGTLPYQIAVSELFTRPNGPPSSSSQL